jgi:hypothetical protein
MKNDSKTDVILEHLRAYAEQWEMLDDTSEEQYQWVIDFAEKQIEDSTKTIEHVERKADAMMRYTGLLLTLIALALTYAISKDSPRQDALFFLPVLVALLFSIWNALLCTRPVDHPSAPLIQEAFADAQHPGGNQLFFMRAWIVLEYRLWLLCVEKGNYVETSLYGLLLALIWLVLGVACVVFKSPLSRFMPSFSMQSYVLVVGSGSVAALYLYRRWKSAHFCQAQWLNSIHEIESPLQVD